MLKILFIHGLASSGQYKMADMLRMLLKPCEVIAPDIPIDPVRAMSLVRSICEKENPDLIVGYLKPNTSSVCLTTRSNISNPNEWLPRCSPKKTEISAAKSLRNVKYSSRMTEFSRSRRTPG